MAAIEFPKTFHFLRAPQIASGNYLSNSAHNDSLTILPLGNFSIRTGVDISSSVDFKVLDVA